MNISKRRRDTFDVKKISYCYTENECFYFCRKWSECVSYIKLFVLHKQHFMYTGYIFQPKFKVKNIIHSWKRFYQSSKAIWNALFCVLKSWFFDIALIPSSEAKCFSFIVGFGFVNNGRKSGLERCCWQNFAFHARVV